MKTVLLYPPRCNPRSPYLSLPSLYASLKAAGHDVVLKDLNLDFFYHVLCKKDLENDCTTLAEKKEILKATPWIRESRSLLLAHGSVPKKHMKQARRHLRWAYDRLFKKYEFEAGYQSIHHIMSSLPKHGDNEFASFLKEDVIPWLKKEGPGIVGISIVFPNQLSKSFELAKIIKQQVAGAHLVIGGPQVTKLAEDLSSFPEMSGLIDSMIVSNGEKPLNMLADCIKTGSSLSAVPNLIYFKEGKVIRNRVDTPQSINELTTPEFQDLHLHRYLLGGVILPLITSRGCYWGKCVFCTYREIHGRKTEFRKIPHVVEDMLNMKKRFGCSYIHLVDDAMPPKRCGALSNEIVSRGLDFKWKCNARLEKAFTPELCRLMARAGCYKVVFGLESYNQRVLDLMGKGIRVKHVKPVLKNFVGAGIKTSISCMIGFPTETAEEVEKTRRFLEENKDLYTTCVVQAFNLEGETELDRNPEKFGITRVFREEKERHGRRYGYRYETKKGLSWEESEKMARELQYINTWEDLPEPEALPGD
ncbi:MAG: B12-binding domain-containing radical SAM protein [Desulfobacterales bacterium]|nr:B12-binding domain-containing radical SAM protein [Desulfobacterales bacterium]